MVECFNKCDSEGKKTQSVDTSEVHATNISKL